MRRANEKESDFFVADFSKNSHPQLMAPLFFLTSKLFVNLRAPIINNITMGIMGTWYMVVSWWRHLISPVRVFTILMAYKCANALWPPPSRPVSSWMIPCNNKT